MINDIEAGIEFIKDVVGEIPSTIDDLLKIIQGALDGGIGDLENLIGQLVPALDSVDLPPNVQKLVDQIKQILTRTVNGTGHTGPSEFCATSI